MYDVMLKLVEHSKTYFTAEGPDRSKTGGGPLALKALNVKVFSMLFFVECQTNL